MKEEEKTRRLGLDDIPDELVLMVVEFVGSSRRLALTCSRLYGLLGFFTWKRARSEHISLVAKRFLVRSLTSGDQGVVDELHVLGRLETLTLDLE